MSRSVLFRRSHGHYCTYCGSLLCQHCRRTAGKEKRSLCPDAATWDHIVPISRDRRVNQVVGRGKVMACSWCNNDRKDNSIFMWQMSVIKRWKAGELDETGARKARGIEAGILANQAMHCEVSR